MSAPGHALPRIVEVRKNILKHNDERARALRQKYADAGVFVLSLENVRNLVCPSSFDLGESLRVVLLSVTEGEDKPLKYPTIFHSADLAVITKTDLAQAAEFDLARAQENIHAVAPAMPIRQVSAKTGYGMDSWLEFQVQRRSAE